MTKRSDSGAGRPQFGNNRPWSKKATRRRWDLNIQKVQVVENGRLVTKRLSTSEIRTLFKAGR
jgi:large subunit ribosomal protein L28